MDGKVRARVETARCVLVTATLGAVSLVDRRVATRAPADTTAILASYAISSDRCQPKRRT